MSGAPRILVVDNYDSFVHNLVHYLAELGAECLVRRNDDQTISDLLEQQLIDGVLISPGPGRPETAGLTLSVISVCADRRIPLLGVCLGHQAIAIAFGGAVIKSHEPRHGKPSLIFHDGTGLCAQLPNPFSAARYHSLIVAEESLPADLVVNARTDSGEVMALSHRALPLYGVQFHPESVLTEAGHALLAQWLADVQNQPTLAGGHQLLA